MWSRDENVGQSDTGQASGLWMSSAAWTEERVNNHETLVMTIRLRLKEEEDHSF